MKVRIKIPYKAKGLPDVNYVKDVNSLIPQRISQLIEVGFIYNNENNEEESVMIQFLLEID